MVFLEKFSLDTFFKGLISGVIIGAVLNKVPNYIYSLIWNNGIKKDEVQSNSKDKPESSTIDEYKMALLVRHDLKMGKGKVAAQCSHAMVHSYEAGLKLIPGDIANWESSGRQVDIFKIADEETMLKIKDLAAEEKFIVYIVVDAGRTQVAPRSKTVMAIGPAKCSRLNEITREFECAAVSITAYNKGKLCGLPSKCARVVLRASDLKTIEYTTKQCKQVGIQTAEFIDNGNITVLAIGPATAASINDQVKNFKLY